MRNQNIAIPTESDAGFPDVQSAIDGMLQGKLIPMEMRQLCKGSGNCHQKDEA